MECLRDYGALTVPAAETVAAVDSTDLVIDFVVVIVAGFVVIAVVGGLAAAVEMEEFAAELVAVVDSVEIVVTVVNSADFVVVAVESFPVVHWCPLFDSLDCRYFRFVVGVNCLS